MPRFEVNGTVTWNFQCEVDAETQEEAEQYAEDGVQDGMFMNSYMPDSVDINWTRKLPDDKQAVAKDSAATVAPEQPDGGGVENKTEDGGL